MTSPIFKTRARTTGTSKVSFQAKGTNLNIEITPGPEPSGTLATQITVSEGPRHEAGLEMLKMLI